MQFGLDSHHANTPVTDADCQICHAEVHGDPNHNNGAVQLRDPDSGALLTVSWIDGNRATLTAGDVVTLTTFYQNCHDGDGATRLGGNAHDPFGTGVSAIPAIGAHSNEDFNDAAEAAFYVGCIQCHTSHGSDNLALIDSGAVIRPGVISGVVVVMATTGAGSFDAGTGDGICVVAIPTAAIQAIR